MRFMFGLYLIIGLILMIGVAGCNKDNSLAPSAPSIVMTDQQALQVQVTTIDSIADFSTSDEATIDDAGMRSPNFDGMSPEMMYESGHLGLTNTDSIAPLRWGRHIEWKSITRNYTVTMLGDTGAFVTVAKTVPGEFWVGFGRIVNDSIIIDTTVKKPFVETITRNVIFKRIDSTSDREKNWRPVAISLVRGATQVTNQFSITSIEVIDSVQHYDTLITNPLGTWMKLGIYRGCIPRFVSGDSITVRATIVSPDDSTEIALLRHSVGGRGLMHRIPMKLVSTTGTAGNYTRVYEKSFRTIMPPMTRVARFNAIVDVFSHGSIFSMSEPFTNEFWGNPYIVRPR